MKKFAAFTVLLCVLLSNCTGIAPSYVSSPDSVSGVPATPQVSFLPTITALPRATPYAAKIPLPPAGVLYHGVFPGGRTGAEDDITLDDLQEYETEVGKRAAWVYFSNNWYRSREFPLTTTEWIRGAGSIPYIRLMLRSARKFDEAERVFTLQNILDGQFDSDLEQWCVAAREFGTPLLVEYGTEMNSDSFPWSGVVNGGATLADYGDPEYPDGPERFRDAYRHIIKICRDAGAVNITWVFHADTESTPDEDWNDLENYYPGDEWIDWIGLSAYGAFRPSSSYFNIFRIAMDRTYPRVQAMAPDKPVIISEFGSTKNSPVVDQVDWARKALTDLVEARYEGIIGFSWWNEAWENDSDPANNTSMRLQDNPELALVFQELIGNNPDVVERIIP